MLDYLSIRCLLSHCGGFRIHIMTRTTWLIEFPLQHDTDCHFGCHSGINVLRARQPWNAGRESGLAMHQPE